VDGSIHRPVDRRWKGLITNSCSTERKEDVQRFRKALGFATKSSPCSKTGRWHVSFPFAQSEQETFGVDAQDKEESGSSQN